MLGRPALPREVQRRVRLMMRAGVVLDDAAATVSVSKAVAWRWFREAGGVLPASCLRSSRICCADVPTVILGAGRDQCLAGCWRECPGHRAAIRSLTVDSQPGIGARRRSSKDGLSCVRGASPGRRARMPDPSRRCSAATTACASTSRIGPSRKHSPEQTSQRLRLDFPDEPEMWVSHETIYRALYVQGRGALSRELVRCLRTGRALRKPRRRTAERRGRIREHRATSANGRPEADDRAVPGHWEGDLIAGPQHHSAIRKTRRAHHRLCPAAAPTPRARRPGGGSSHGRSDVRTSHASTPKPDLGSRPRNDQSSRHRSRCGHRHLLL